MSLQLVNHLGLATGCVSITKSCASVLQALMPLSENNTRYLWIDAVCIDQTSLQEKEFQIPLLGEIYSKAALVIGHLTKDNQYPISLLTNRMVQSLSHGTLYNLNKIARGPLLAELTALFGHSYFGRAWIVQEIALAKSFIIIYGREYVRFEHLQIISQGQAEDRILETGLSWPWRDDSRVSFSGALANFVTHGTAIFRERTQIVSQLRQGQNQRSSIAQLTLAQLIDQNMSLGAQEPRDQIYALLSLASDAAVPELRPNYNPTVPNWQIFTKISWHYLQDGQHLHLFLSAGLALPADDRTTEDPEPTAELPSWAYDFATGPRQAARLTSWAADQVRERICGLTCSLSSDMKQLSIHGSMIDRITHYAPPPPVLSHRTRTAFAERLLNMEDVFFGACASIFPQTRDLAQMHIPEYYFDGASRDEAYLRSMMTDRLWDQTPAPPEAQVYLQRMISTILALTQGQPLPTHEIQMPAGLTDKQRTGTGASLSLIMTRTWLTHAFIITERGYMGWAPPQVQEGDIFCLFDGCAVPFALRPTGVHSTFYLLGSGYVHGFMPGQETRPQSIYRQWFKLV